MRVTSTATAEISLDQALRLVRLLVLVASSVVVDLVGDPTGFHEAPNRMDFLRVFSPTKVREVRG